MDKLRVNVVESPSPQPSPVEGEGEEAPSPQPSPVRGEGEEGEPGQALRGNDGVEVCGSISYQRRRVRQFGF